MSDPNRDPSLDLHTGPSGEPLANATFRATRVCSGPAVGGGEVRHKRTVGWRGRRHAAVALVAGTTPLQLIWFAHAFLVLHGHPLRHRRVGRRGSTQRFRIPRGWRRTDRRHLFAVMIGASAGWRRHPRRAPRVGQKLPEAVDRVEQWVDRRNSGCRCGTRRRLHCDLRPRPRGHGAAHRRRRAGAPLEHSSGSDTDERTSLSCSRS